MSVRPRISFARQVLILQVGVVVVVAVLGYGLVAWMLDGGSATSTASGR